MVKQWNLTSLTCLLLLAGIEIMFKTIQITLLKSWSKQNYVQDHPNYTFEKLEQAFCKQFKTMKNNEGVYMQL